MTHHWIETTFRNFPYTEQCFFCGVVKTAENENQDCSKRPSKTDVLCPFCGGAGKGYSQCDLETNGICPWEETSDDHEAYGAWCDYNEEMELRDYDRD